MIIITTTTTTALTQGVYMYVSSFLWCPANNNSKDDTNQIMRITSELTGAM